MSYGILPALIGTSEERKPLLEKLIDLTESASLSRGGLDDHHNQCYVGVWGLLLSSHAPLRGGAVTPGPSRVAPVSCITGGVWVLSAILP